MTIQGLSENLQTHCLVADALGYQILVPLIRVWCKIGIVNGVLHIVLCSAQYSVGAEAYGVANCRSG